ncbi:hypothetical protein KCU65_g7039, partial [Aureobasidium melanogenum]
MSTGKETPQVNTTSIDNEEQAFPDPQWKTGLRARFPWTGAIALFTILLCANSSIIVLLFSDGKRQKHWAEKIGPSVLLSAFNGIANICFGVAIANGVAITWWRKALRGATIKELHRSWQFSSSIKDVVLYGRYFNFIALAALAAKLTIIDGILLQKAAGTEVNSDPAKKFKDSIYANTTMPFTADFDDRSGEVEGLYDWFQTEVNGWSRNVGIFQNNYVRCNGTCLFDILGTGFGIDCQTEELPINYGSTVYQETMQLVLSNDTSGLEITPEKTLFNITFDAFYGATGIDGDYSRIAMNITFTNTTTSDNDTASCPGTMTRHSCILRPAIIRYPVTVEDTTETTANHPISNMYLGYNTTSYGGQLYYTEDGGETYYMDDVERSYLMNGTGFNASAHQLNGFALEKYDDVTDDMTFAHGFATVLGGMVKVFNTYFAGASSMTFDGIHGGFVLNKTGSADTGVDSFTAGHDTSNTSFSGCDFQYPDPLSFVVREINLLTFTLAVDPFGHNYLNNNESILTPINATQYGTSIHYKTNKPYMWGALASMLFCILCVLPSYWGYWQLGRDVTLGPFEIANAFRAPVLDHPAVANAGVKDLIREVGQREVKYGAMVHNDASGRLAIAEPEAVRRVHPRISDRRF